MSAIPTIKVSALARGTVLDHLLAGSAMRAYRVLGLGSEYTVTVGINLASSRLGQKDIIKIEGHELTEKEAAKIAMLSPDATLSIIRDYRVVHKIPLKLPERVEGILRCPNPACITRYEKTPGCFRVDSASPVTVTCEYCERTITEEQLDFV